MSIEFFLSSEIFLFENTNLTSKILKLKKPSCFYRGICTIIFDTGLDFFIHPFWSLKKRKGKKTLKKLSWCVFIQLFSQYNLTQRSGGIFHTPIFFF